MPTLEDLIHALDTANVSSVFLLGYTHLGVSDLEQCLQARSVLEWMGLGDVYTVEVSAHRTLTPREMSAELEALQVLHYSLHTNVLGHVRELELRNPKDLSACQHLVARLNLKVNLLVT